MVLHKKFNSFVLNVEYTKYGTIQSTIHKNGILVYQDNWDREVEFIKLNTDLDVLGWLHEHNIDVSWMYNE